MNQHSQNGTQRTPQAICTIYKDIYSKDKPHYITIQTALQRIREGHSKVKINELRDTLDKERQDALKHWLPSVCFSGTFETRTDSGLKLHSGYLVLDFDDVYEISEMMGKLSQHEFIYAAWTSPRANGIKALVRIADTDKHKEHFDALKDIFPDIDKSGRNVSRVCYESFDPNIYINENAVAFTKIKTIEKIEAKEVLYNDGEVFRNLLKWLSNKNDAFVKGERNVFIFKLASACCRFGVSITAAESLILAEYPPSNDFTLSECKKAIQSAYKSSAFGSSVFEKDILVDKATRKEVKFDEAIYDENVRPRDVIYAEEVKSAALNIYNNGYEKVDGIGVKSFDDLFKLKKGDVTLISGISNMGKSQILKWFMLMRIIKFADKFAVFAPEDFPTEEYYHDFVEMYLGCDCTPKNGSRPSENDYSTVYDLIGRHIFFIYPKDLSPTPDYVKERFLEMIVKEKVTALVIDPFNQLTHDYGRQRSDLYLETILGDFNRFAKGNSVPMLIVAHPKTPDKNSEGNYKVPEATDISGGMMWMNKCDNVLIYHRPKSITMPDDVTCTIYTKKIKRQKSVGRVGWMDCEYDRMKRRFIFEGIDPIDALLNNPRAGFAPSKPLPTQDFWND